MKLIAHGAEAKVFLIKGEKINSNYFFKINIDNKNLEIEYAKEFLILKYRYPKKYRHPSIDANFRKYRTRREARILKRLSNLINVPELVYYNEDEGILCLEYIDGKKLSDNLENLNYKDLMYLVGKQIGMIHKNKIVHGDLTTSNIILYQDKVYFIDFGLSYFSSRIEDYAVDIHLLKEALESKHWKIFEDAFNSFLEGYKDSFSEKYTWILIFLWCFPLENLPKVSCENIHRELTFKDITMRYSNC